MPQYIKNTTGIILAISLIMLVGGIVGSIYCVNKIHERLNWAESVGDPEYTKTYNYQIVEDEVISLGTYLGISAGIAVIGGFVSLAMAFRKRFSWRGIKGLASYLVGAFVILLGILGILSIFLNTFIVVITIGVSILAILFIAKRINIKIMLRESLLTLGMFLVVLGTFGTIKLYIWSIFETLQEFQIFYAFTILVFIGVTVVGTLISLGAIFWPKRQTDKLPPPTPSPS